MAFRDTITAATLRAEAQRGNLGTYKIGRTIFTTLDDIEEMKKRCRVRQKDPGSSSTADGSSSLSETDQSSAALAAL